MSKESKVKIVMSHRCVFPKGAFFYSTAEMAELAREVGYEGVEFLPTWRVVWEMKRYGKLLAPRSMVASGHRDWRFDRVMEAKLKGKPWWWYQIKNKEDWLFPSSGICRRALQNFQRVYGVPISVAWFEDAVNFSPVMLELWSVEQGVDQKRLVKWLTQDREHRGVVVDTAKFTSWCETNKMSKKSMWKTIEPFVWELHYRVKGRYDRHMNLKGWLSEDTEENLVWILKEKGW